MPRGGPRPGSGRKRGSRNKRTVEAIAKARQTGLLPHEILLAIAQGRGVLVLGFNATMEQRMQAAEKAAPYYAPRLAAIVMKVTDKSNPWEELLSLIEKQPRVVLPRSARARLRLIDGTGTRVPEETPGRSRPASR
jgi:hypothetical protein